MYESSTVDAPLSDMHCRQLLLSSAGVHKLRSEEIQTSQTSQTIDVRNSI